MKPLWKKLILGNSALACKLLVKFWITADLEDTKMYLDTQNPNNSYAAGINIIIL